MRGTGEQEQGTQEGGRRACWISRAVSGCVDAASQREHRCRRPRFRPRGQQPHGGRRVTCPSGQGASVRGPPRELRSATRGLHLPPCHSDVSAPKGSSQGQRGSDSEPPFPRKGRPRARRLCRLTLSSPVSSRHARLRSRPSSRRLEVSQDDSRVPSSRRASVFVTTEKLLRRRKAQRTSTVG